MNLCHKSLVTLPEKVASASVDDGSGLIVFAVHVRHAFLEQRFAGHKLYLQLEYGSMLEGSSVTCDTLAATVDNKLYRSRSEAFKEWSKDERPAFVNFDVTAFFLWRPCRRDPFLKIRLVREGRGATFGTVGKVDVPLSPGVRPVEDVFSIRKARSCGLGGLIGQILMSANVHKMQAKEFRQALNFPRLNVWQSSSAILVEGSACAAWDLPDGAEKNRNISNTGRDRAHTV
jgi:hypothetical protein